VPDPTLRGRREQIVLQGDVPSPANPPSGCRFHTRCFKAQEICSVEEPQLELRGDGAGTHASACHFAEPRTIVETVDVSDVEPDTRFTVTDLRDDVLAAEEPADYEDGIERSRTQHERSAHAPQEVTRLIDEQPDDHRS
jgi:oligopeptide transport system ATP-binding protein